MPLPWQYAYSRIRDWSFGCCPWCRIKNSQRSVAHSDSQKLWIFNIGRLWMSEVPVTAVDPLKLKRVSSSIYAPTSQLHTIIVLTAFYISLFKAADILLSRNVANTSFIWSALKFLWNLILMCYCLCQLSLILTLPRNSFLFEIFECQVSVLLSCYSGRVWSDANWIRWSENQRFAGNRGTGKATKCICFESKCPWWRLFCTSAREYSFVVHGVRSFVQSMDLHLNFQTIWQIFTQFHINATAVQATITSCIFVSSSKS